MKYKDMLEPNIFLLSFNNLVNLLLVTPPVIDFD